MSPPPFSLHYLPETDSSLEEHEICSIGPFPRLQYPGCRAIPVESSSYLL